MHFVNAHNFIPRGLLWGASSIFISILILGAGCHALSFTKANLKCSHHRKPLTPKTHLTQRQEICMFKLPSTPNCKSLMLENLVFSVFKASKNLAANC